MTQPLVSGGLGMLGKYELLRLLARGGMAELFLARVTGIEGFEKLVALKRILPQYAENARFIEMFLQEARLAAQLRHSNIAQVFDVGRVGQSYFFTMECIDGVDARKPLYRAIQNNGSIPLEHAIAIVLGTAAGLHHAHEQRGPNGRPLGIVHRDVSPSNVLIGIDGIVKLVDFGIAKATALSGETRSGMVKGKVSYMSPEQCRGEPIDRRSDVFSLGILLYELTTASFLFRHENEFSVVQEILRGDFPPPSSRQPGYHPSLERIVGQALRLSPDDRFPTAQALAEALEGFVREEKLSLSPMALGNYIRPFVEEAAPNRRSVVDAQTSRLGEQLHTVTAEVVPENTPEVRSEASMEATKPESGVLHRLQPNPALPAKGATNLKSIIVGACVLLLVGTVGLSAWWHIGSGGSLNAAESVPVVQPVSLPSAPTQDAAPAEPSEALDYAVSFPVAAPTAAPPAKKSAQVRRSPKSPNRPKRISAKQDSPKPIRDGILIPEAYGKD